jgi:hypothetical protein
MGVVWLASSWLKLCKPILMGSVPWMYIYPTIVNSVTDSFSIFSSYKGEMQHEKHLIPRKKTAIWKPHYLVNCNKYETRNPSCHLSSHPSTQLLPKQVGGLLKIARRMQWWALGPTRWVNLRPNVACGPRGRHPRPWHGCKGSTMSACGSARRGKDDQRTSSYGHLFWSHVIDN